MGPGTIFRRSVLTQYGFRDTQRRFTGDLEFWFRLALHGKLFHVPEVLATHRTHSQSTSITARSSKISEELISMVESVIASGDLPTTLAVKPNRIRSCAYFYASFYCSSEPVVALRYLLTSFLRSPVRFMTILLRIFIDYWWSFIRLLVKPLKMILLRLFIPFVAKFLSKILPRPTYDSIRTSWRKMRIRFGRYL